MFFLSHCYQSFLSLGVTVHLASLGCPPTLCWSLDLLWGSSDSNQVLLPCVLVSNEQLLELVHFPLWELSMAFYIFHRHRVCLVDCVDLMQLLQLVGRFWVFFLSHTAPGLQLFYFHLCMWVVHWGLLLRLSWRTWVCPYEGQMWKWWSCLGHRGSGSSRYSGEFTAREAGNRVL